MSCFEREYGTIIIPKKDWTRFKAHIREAHNRALLQEFTTLTALYAKLMELHRHHKGVKADRNKFYWEGLFDLAWDELSPQFDRNHASHALIHHMPTTPPIKPTRAKYTLSKASDTDIHGMWASLDFENETHTVIWTVPDNNRAVEAAHNSVLGRAFFAALDGVTWTRGSGGTIYSGNEYADEAAEERGEGRRDSARYTYGPKKVQDERTGHAGNYYGRQGMGYRYM